MTLEEAIKHARDTAENRTDLCEECRAEHKQLAEWLEQLVKLTEENERLIAERDVLNTLVKDLRGRNKGLQRANQSLAKDCDLLEDELNECVCIKADTVREMQERIKAKAYTNNYCREIVLVSDINQIAKEMLEGDCGAN